MGIELPMPSVPSRLLTRSLRRTSSVTELSLTSSKRKIAVGASLDASCALT